MKEMLSSVDLVIECRLAGTERLIVYTKQDLGSEGTDEDRRVCGIYAYAVARHLGL